MNLLKMRVAQVESPPLVPERDPQLAGGSLIGAAKAGV
jgi:hypothetical protein